MQHWMLGNADNEVFGDFRPPALVTESAPRERSDTEVDAMIIEAAENSLRTEAMGAVLTWVEDGDWSYDALDALLEGLASDTDDDELTDDEQEQYEALWETAMEALESLGASESNIEQAVGGDDDAAEKLGKFLAGKLDDVTKSDDDLVAEFGVGGSLVMESGRRVIRNGETRRMPRRRKRKRRMTAAQRAALKKARRKAHNSGARRSRKRSMRRRKQMGL